MKKKALCFLMIGILSFTAVSPVRAVTIDELRRQLQDTQSQLNAISGQASGLEGQKDAVEEEIDELDGTLIELMASISLLEDEIEEKKEQIVQVGIELEEAVEKEEIQYDSMKMRIKFMYESGNQNYVQLLLESKSISDMLNKADYIEKLYEYDRKLLTQYEETRKQVADLKVELEEEEAALEAEEYELKEEQSALEIALNEKKAEAKNYEVQIAQINQSAAAYKALIKQQTSQIKQLEAEEAARKAAEEAAKKKKEDTSSSTAKNENKAGNNTVAVSQAASMIQSASGSAKGKEIASFGCRFIGNPYVAGGTSLTNGADCSGFTQAVYREFGISIPRNSASQRGAGKEVSYGEAQPGDLVCYAGHVGMYIGNGYIVHASTQKTGIKITPATYKPILSVRRIV